MNSQKPFLIAAVLAGALSCTVMPFAAVAQTINNPMSVAFTGTLDPRIKQFAYSPEIVYTLPITVGMATHVQLADDEQLTEKPRLGELVQWRIGGNEKNLYIKALKPDVITSLTLVTDKRTYQFELVSTTSASKRVQKAYFSYPEEEEKVSIARRAVEADAVHRKSTEMSATAMDPASLNFAYHVEGEAAFKPTAIYDNGTLTWMRMPKGQDLPAVFMVGADNKLMPVNYAVPDRSASGDRNQIIIERTAPRWVLKIGKAEVKVIADK